MTTNFHTPVSVGAAANAATVNGPLAELDEEITKMQGGGGVNDETLIAWVEGEAYQLLAITRDANGVITSSTVEWPDGAGGEFTADSINATWLAIDGYHIHHSPSLKVVTQAAVTRNASGDVTVKPALVVS